MVVELEFTYCGKKWNHVARSQAEIELMKCSKCGDSGLKVRDASKSKIDGYAGCPPFPEKKNAAKDIQYYGLPDDYYGSSD